MSRRTVAIFAIAWMVVVVAVASSAITIYAMGGAAQAGLSAQKYEQLDEVLRIIEERYYVEVEEDGLLEDAIRGAFSSLDPYSFYYSADEMAAMFEQTSGEYYGIGVLVTMDGEGGIAILRIYDGPARDADLHEGDRIVAIDGTALSVNTSADLTAATAMIKAETQTPVLLTIERDGEVFDVEVQRAQVEANRTRHAILENGIGYLEISEFFGDDVTGTRAALDDFVASGVTKLVLDVRDNTGGDLNHVVQIADMLLPEGVIVSVEDRYGNSQHYDSQESCYDLEMVVLVNGMSASATEILAGALQDYDRATVMGTQTFGKGVVQDVIQFENGAGMQLTTMQYFRPSGEAVHEVGITPDIIVELGENYDPANYEIDLENDNQLREAVKYLESLS